MYKNDIIEDKDSKSDYCCVKRYVKYVKIKEKYFIQGCVTFLFL